MADRAGTAAYFPPLGDMTDTPANLEDLLPSRPQTSQPTRGYNGTGRHDMPQMDQRRPLNGQSPLRLNHSRQDTTAEADILFSLASSPATARSPQPMLPMQPRSLASMPPQPQHSSLERVAPVNVPSSSATHPPVDPEATTADGTALESDFPNVNLGDPQIFTALQRNGRTLAHAVAAMTEKSPAGNMMSSFTVAELVRAVKFGRAYITLEGPVSTLLEALAREMGYSVYDLTQDGATAAARASALQAYSINLHEGIFIHLVLPDIPDVPFERKRGGGCWLPPAGLLEHHLASGEVMKHFDLQGPFSPIYSQVSPSQADVTLLGVKVTLWELAAFFATHGRHWKDFGRRIAGNGVTATEFARLANMIRCADEDEGLLKSTIENQFAKYAPTRQREMVTTFSCCEWEKPKPEDINLIDYPLRFLATGMKRSHFPKGRHQGPLTKCIEWALDSPDGGRLQLSHVKKLVSERKFDTEAPFEDVLVGSTLLNADEAAISSLKPTLEEYRIICEKLKTALR